MAGVQDQLEIKFRLTDGSDIGPKPFPAATTVATLKENILAQWPKEKENGPRTLKDVKLISAGKILENNRTVGECRSPLCDIPGGVTTMHVVVQPSSVEKDSHFVFLRKSLVCGFENVTLSHSLPSFGLEERGKSSKAKQMRLCYIIICTSKSRNDKGREFGAGIR
ncbi:hypothetical protein DKX38_027090 [Salix brachista]|uniref:Ubiquitin-like domain-containing protein n=1 Tax=Salix brachista TaxID=2182728 RepID=A0A5N5JC62_9ROSI|nr:hypothetical protein DKX38_027090 [Salix brachista]